MSLKHFKTDKIMEGELDSFHIWFFVILNLAYLIILYLKMCLLYTNISEKKIEMVKKISTKKEFKKRETYT